MQKEPEILDTTHLYSLLRQEQCESSCTCKCKYT